MPHDRNLVRKEKGGQGGCRRIRDGSMMGGGVREGKGSNFVGPHITS